ncbi:MAG: hypothetical protein ABSF92_12555 [Candidatus Acidiferrales bacterium]
MPATGFQKPETVAPRGKHLSDMRIPAATTRLALRFLLVPLLLLPFLEAPARAADALSVSDPLDLGFRQMYNLDFEEAHNTFREWQKFHPHDPFGLTGEAAAYLFEEFDRLGVLQSELFVDREKFEERNKTVPDPALRASFGQALERSDQLADAILARSPKDENALFAKILNLGLRADYLALIEKRNVASLGRIKRAGQLAGRLLAENPECYDAYLAVGVENYMLSLKPAPVRWFLQLYGAETDKNRGVKNLQLTAEKGHYLQPYARLLLAVAALRDQRRDEARALLLGLSQEFPRNRLYRREFSRLQ